MKNNSPERGFGDHLTIEISFSPEVHFRAALNFNVVENFIHEIIQKEKRLQKGCAIYFGFIYLLGVYNGFVLFYPILKRIKSLVRFFVKPIDNPFVIKRTEHMSTLPIIFFWESSYWNLWIEDKKFKEI